MSPIALKILDPPPQQVRMHIKGAACLRAPRHCACAHCAAGLARHGSRFARHRCQGADQLPRQRTFAARRVWHDLLADGAACGLHRIERLMHLQALRARPRRRRLLPDAGERQAEAPSQPTSGSQLRSQRPPTANGLLTSVYLDGRRLALPGRGHRLVLAPRGRMVDAGQHDRAARGRCSDDGDLAAWQARHDAASLRPGQPITSEQFQRLLADHGIDCSMSRLGNVWDNSAMETFFSSLKIERTDRKTTASAWPEQTSSTTSSASTIPGGVTRRSATKARGVRDDDRTNLG